MISSHWGANSGDLTRQRAATLRHTILLGGVKNLVLAVTKLSAGWMSQSTALLSDGLHSLADLLADGFVLLGAQWGAKAADEDHPYGHRRIETAASLLMAILLVMIGTAAGWAALSGLTRWQMLPPEILGPRLESIEVIGVAAGALLLNELMYQLTRRSACQIQSQLLLANAWHHRSDSLTSFIVLLSCLGAYLPADWMRTAPLDALACGLIALMIWKAGFSVGWTALRELVDTAPVPETLQAIERCIKCVPGVLTLHQLRTRMAGRMMICDVHIQVDSHLSVSEGHFIGHQVQSHLRAAMPTVQDVTVHIDPEDDQAHCMHAPLPSRLALLKQLKSCWQGLVPETSIERIILHYLGDQLSIELLLPLETLGNKGVIVDSAALSAHAKTLRQTLTNALKTQAWAADVHLYFYADLHEKKSNKRPCF